MDYLPATEYDYLTGGTSNSTAFVSGLASLLLAQDPSRTVALLRSIIQETADDQMGKPTEDTPG
ncbi:MAG: S8 family serine peptidase [Fibrobacterota bacterium]|nr:S8 family serine peptidase [Fibrobacterota bacterium]